MKAAIITVSDKGHRGERVDESGPAIRDKLSEIQCPIIFETIVPDEMQEISSAIVKASDEHKADIVITTGGTGLAPRDITPEATKGVIDRMAPGFMEAIRIKTSQITPKAMLSRGISGVRGQTLVINLPGSVKACRESMDVILPVLNHAVDILQGRTEHS